MTPLVPGEPAVGWVVATGPVTGVVVRCGSRAVVVVVIAFSLRELWMA
jgi:hypothetical protein